MRCATLLVDPGKAGDNRYSLQDYVNADSGFKLQVPENWVAETPGGRIELFQKGEYGGKRIIISIEPLASKAADLRIFGDSASYGKSRAAEIEADNPGTTTTLLATSEKNEARYYYYEYVLNSFKPQHYWVVVGAGLGQNPTARKFRLRQQITVSCQLPEENVETDPQDVQLLKQIIDSFQFIDEQS
ncbi:hypothetical protein CYMTET_9273 [Cymbomonas tetramitiformis]|uniref:PsbP C-terminal domain-containing protein n=1 Tax=Cymbomonas tetramitiformis TaxID=36881 RepID=A0AAE0LF16_9CHLO|nr:hypothetical protein CYMTET_9273 [Cymbomonas tetramitiformis]